MRTDKAGPRSRGQELLRWVSSLLAAAGFGALVWCATLLLLAHFYQKRAIQELKEQSLQPALESRQAPAGPMTAGSLIGRIEIPRIGLTAVVLEGTDEASLLRGVGHIPGTPLPGSRGNIALAGHRDSFFRPLRNISKNDSITVTTREGSYRYRVESTQVVGPEDIDVLKASMQPVLTLVTCYPFYYVGPAPRRFIVRATAVPPYSPKRST